MTLGWNLKEGPCFYETYWWVLNAGLLDGLLGVAGMIKLLVINYGSFPKKIPS